MAAQTTDPTSAAERIEKLEHAQRRLQLQIVGLGALVLVLAIFLVTKRRTITAQNFLLESGGRVRASLTASPEGAPGLILTDGNGRMRAALQVSREGVPALLFGDQGGNVRAVMGVPSDGVPSIVLLADSGKVRYVTP